MWVRAVRQGTKGYRGFATSRVWLNEAKNEAKKEAAEAAQNSGEKSVAALESELASTKEKLLAKDKECAELKDLYVRSVADFRNLQETTKREMQKAKDFALQQFAKDLLESIDNFGHALNAVKDETLKSNQEVAQLYEGVKMTRDVFEKTLARHGLSKIDPVDERFDPNRHEATFQAPVEGKEPGTVFHVQQPGFELNGRVLRPAKVGVVRDN
ncbi:hypothetical protein KL948_000884 [Ogataea haglerorum]|nr:hypothetical protein KL915_001552 [Ogataea haglerorum]KAG7733682.1 hypothetical protein KL948_000884 [Ogataea haglerorum]KAG7741131.1 hypothetical protein KL923_001772 [Ogataea haglerorum]KAG7755258.1 hypothetical protein KL947_004446 [Ogataea haglerorum]KAG7770950.1 hypothetical protein KL931_001772 [Ogataea haglerorum]